MSATAVDEVLVGPLRSDGRRRDLLARLDQLPPAWQVVLRGCYLQGRAPEDVAEQCRLTPAELDQVRADALTALGRSRARATRTPGPTPYG